MQEYFAWLMREWPVCAWVLIISYIILIAGIATLADPPAKKRYWIGGRK